jgi:hypothetical protein
MSKTSCTLQLHPRARYLFTSALGLSGSAWSRALRSWFTVRLRPPHRSSSRSAEFPLSLVKVTRSSWNCRITSLTRFAKVMHSSRCCLLFQHSMWWHETLMLMNSLSPAYEAFLRISPGRRPQIRLKAARSGLNAHLASLSQEPVKQ